MAFRERIEAALQVKDAARFKAGMETAARSVRGFGKDNTEAAAQTELLKKIMQKLDKQSAETAAALRALAHEVNEVGNQMLETAAKTEVANKVIKKSGTNAVFLGKSWAFWKDRLSLTRSEILTTAITIGSYLSPALVSLASSLGTALVGGGIVGGTGLAGFTFALVTLSTVINPAIKGIKKIDAAQYQYNVTVQQYGAASLQASRSAAHLYAVIKNNGGWQAERAAVSLKKFSQAWKDITAPGRRTSVGILSNVLGAGRAALPTIGNQANQMAASLGAGVRSVLGGITSPEGLSTIRSLGRVFSGSIGPVLRGISSVLTIIGRVIRAATPWVIKFAFAWESVTASWAQAATFKRVTAFVNDGVKHLQAWWKLLEAIARTFNIIWSSTKEQGIGFLATLTKLVNQFNDWLTKMRDTGAIDRFYAAWKRSVGDVIWSITHPLQALNRWIPDVMFAIGAAFVAAAPHILDGFLQAFMNGNGWVRFLTVAFILKKFGFFALVGRKVAETFIGPFMGAFLRAFAAQFIGAAAAEGVLARAAANAGKISGKAFGKGFAYGIPIGLALAYPEIVQSKWYQKLYAGTVGKVFNALMPGLTGGFTGGATGGVIPIGSMSIVGESGPEVATTSSRGTQITPLSGNGLQPFAEIPNMSGAMNFNIYTSVQVDRREIARAVTNQSTYETARRGGRQIKTPG